MIGRRTGFAVVVLLSAGWALAGEFQVRTKHERIELTGSEGRLYHWLKPDEMLLLQVTGPANLGFRVRKVVESSKQTVAVVDLTVVRNDQEQGTVRFRLPPPAEARIRGHDELVVSGEVLVKIEVPPGMQRYRLIASGPGAGLMLQPFLGLQDRKEVVVATPGQVEVPVEPTQSPGPNEPAPRKTAPEQEPEFSPPRLQPPEPDVLPPVASARRSDNAVTIMRPIVYHDEQRFGPGTRVAGTAAVMLTAGTISLLATGGALEQRARDEPVQIPAGTLHQRAERTFEASAVMGVLAAAAAVTTFVLYLVESPAPGKVESTPAPGALVLRF